MALPLPRSLSPSGVSSFRDCALAYRFRTVERLPEPPSEAAMRGTLVHRALELLMCAPAERRTGELAHGSLLVAHDEMHRSPEYAELGLDPDEDDAFLAEARNSVDRYLALEDPATVTPVGLELRLEADVDGVTVRGIIDRLDLGADGDLIITDYKTGRTPGPAHEQSRLIGVHIYSLLCEQTLGIRPTEVRLMYLGREPGIIVSRPSERSARGATARLKALWSAVETACARDDFRPKPGPLCDWCAFQAWCPAFGGDPSQARPTLLPELAT